MKLLSDPTDRVRYRARLELSGRPEAEVVPAVKAWLAKLDRTAPEFEHRQLEALWTLRHFDQIDPPLLEAVLVAKDPRSRSAALRVLASIVDRVPSGLDMVRRAAADESPRVRLEAVRTASFLRVPEAVEALAIADEFPSDRQMDYVKKEAARVLDPEFRQARAAGRAIAFTTDAGRVYLYRSLGNDELAKEPRSTPVYREMLLRPGLDERLRTEAVEALAKSDRKSVVKVVADALVALDQKAGAGKDAGGQAAGIDTATVFELIRLLLGRPRQELAELRGDMERLAIGARQPVMRRIGYVALMNIDAVGAGGDASAKAWQLAADDPRRRLDLIEALPLVGDPDVRSGLYDRIAPLVAVPAAGGGGVPGRFVRIEQTGSMRTLWLDEVEAYAGGTNVALRGKAVQKQAPTGAAVDAGRVIDGTFEPKAAGPRPAASPEDPWWEVDLGSLHPITRIVVRHDRGILGDRLKNFRLVVLDDGRKEVFATDGKADDGLRLEFPLVSEADRMAAVVRRAAFAALAAVRGREADAFKRIAPFVRDPGDRDAAIRALAAIPVAKWPAEEAVPLLDTLIDGMKQATAEQRSTDAGLAAWQFAENLTTLLPPAEGKARRATLAELGVRVVKIGTVYERMAYDKETIAVQAGRPVVFVLENADVMPHNFVVTKPGRMQAIGELAEASAQNPAFAKQNFVPQSPDVLAASTLMQPQGSQRITFTVPTEPGVYPYVCTYPGHWRRMFGAMYVVSDLEGYLADPSAHLAAHPLVIKDELLKDRRPRTEWALADLEGNLVGLEKGRSFVHGRELFRTASCISCHKMGDSGNAFGPELAKLDAKMTPLEIARHILEPSLKIDEKYCSTTVLTDDGRSITGLVIEETPTELAIVENPVAKADPVRIKKGVIDERTTSPVSIMPKGLLDKLTRDEVLDLVAYVAARGQESSCLFNPDGCPHHGKPEGK
ncbi:MAG: HEAT repeat domain-containing protein [Planctomycetia bacterium]